MNSMRGWTNRILRQGGILGVVAMTLAGCDHPPPTGQVLASVDGDDVTKRDVAYEAYLTNLPIGPVSLNAVVDRKLLVRRAKRERLDLTPDYLAAVRRFREATLASLAVQQVAVATPVPDDTAVRAYAAAHAWQFGRRALVEVEDAGHVRVIDTAAVTDGGDAGRLLSAGPGSTIVVGGRPMLVTGIRPAARPVDSNLDIARMAVARRQREDIVRRLVAAEEGSVRVRYQPGFGADR